MVFAAVEPARTYNAPVLTQISDNRYSYPGGQIPQYNKFEITFQVQNTVAQNLQLPFDPNPPNGIDPANYPDQRGISVDALFLPPGTTDWRTAYRQPAFSYQPFTENGPSGWFYPQGSPVWKVRFSPNIPGTWQYKLSARDASGSGESAAQSFTVAQSSAKGFLKVSAKDPRYFEFDDGSPFYALGRQGIAWYNYPTADSAELEKYNQNGIRFIRTWMSGFYGTAWLEWVGGRNIYDGYLPRSGSEAFHDPINNRDYHTMVIDYETTGDTGWYDACRLQFNNSGEAVKRNTNYKLRITYWGENVTGPRNPVSSNYGLVGKIGGWENNCYEPGTNTVITSYGRSTPTGWNTVEGIWNSGSNDFLPRLHIGLENVTQGKTWIREISLREDLGNGQLGPEILTEPSLEYDLYFPERSAYELDKFFELAEKNDIYLKLVLMDKNDMVFSKLNADGSFVMDGQPDNQDEFYGDGRQVNKTRWLQQAYFRYLQARWGYSPSIHSWELTNEGDPDNPNHYILADEMGKDFHCRVFGVPIGPGDGQKCTYDHPNDHLVTTSFWHSFPVDQFWGNSKYPNVDYADVHAYVSTGWLEDPIYESDSAVFHLDYSTDTRNLLANKPIVRGETGIDYLNNQMENTDLQRDLKGVWLHNLLWSSLDPGGLSELYWWKETMDTSPGPDGQAGLYEVYRYLDYFLRGIPLNNGNYVDAQAVLSNSGLSGTGQKDTANNRAHIWIWNKNYTWKNVVNGTNNFTGLSGSVKLSGFAPNSTLPIVWYKFKSDGLPMISSTLASTDTYGNLVLVLPKESDLTDTAIKIGDYPLSPSLAAYPHLRPGIAWGR
jgi:hypothetical protein